MGGNTLMIHRMVNYSVLPYLLAWSLLVLAQSVLIWTNTEALVVAFLAILGGLLGGVVFLRRDLLLKYPLSTLMMIGYLFYYFLLPPVATLLEFKPLTSNLTHPVLDYVYALLTFGSFSLGFLAYTRSRLAWSIRSTISGHVYQPLGFFSRLCVADLFAIGGIGLIAMAYEIFIAGSTQEYSQGSGIFNKLMQGLAAFSYLPFGIFIPRMIGLDIEPLRLDRKVWLILLAYGLVLVMVGTGGNSRGVIFIGFFSVALMKVVEKTLYPDGKKLNLVSLIPLTLVGVMVLGQLSDFATSMVIARQYRSTDSAMSLVSETVKAFFDKDVIREYRLLTHEEVSGDGWDEHYVDNPFFARLSNLKFLDETMDLVQGMDEGKRNIVRQTEVEKILSVFPDPVLKFMDVDIDKEFSGTSSGGDMLLYAATHNSNALQGERVGSLISSGLADFGSWLFVVLVPISLATFVLIDAYVTYVVVTGEFMTILMINPMIATSSFSTFFYLTSAATGVESMSGFSGIFLRGWIQSLVLYCMVSGFARFLVTALGLRSFGLVNKAHSVGQT